MVLLVVYAFYEYFEGNKSSKEEQLLEENVESASNQVLVSDEQASECARIEKEILEKASEIQKIINEITNNRTYLIYPSKKLLSRK